MIQFKINAWKLLLVLNNSIFDIDNIAHKMRDKWAC